MWRHPGFSFHHTRIWYKCLYQVTRTKHGGISCVPLGNNYCTTQRDSETSAQWFLGRTSLDTLFSRSSEHAQEEVKSFDEFGLLSSQTVKPTPSQFLTSERSLMDQLLSRDVSSAVNSSPIPTTADASELGGCGESGDLEQVEELLNQDFAAVMNDMATVDGLEKRSAVCVSGDFDSCNGTTLMVSDTQRLHLRSAFSSASSSVEKDVSSSVQEYPSTSGDGRHMRFDPEIHRPTMAAAEEIISAIHNQDISSLRSILMEKSWPDQRSIGRHLDELFELVIRDSHDIDEAMMFFQDYAASNRRGFLHDVNGIRLASRVARDTRSVAASMETLRSFRNMFLVRSLAAKSSTPVSALKQLYTTVCSIGTADEVEELHGMMVDCGFENSSDIFVHTFTQSMLEKRGFLYVFDKWRSFSTKYGTTCASDLIWEELLVSVKDRKKQARFADELLAHSLLYDDPFAVIGNFLITLVRMKQLDAARLLFTKVSIPGKFFRKPLQNVVLYEDSIHVLENFASLITNCMFAEKRRTKNGPKRVVESTFLSPDLLLVLDTFYRGGRPRKVELPNKNEKRKLHRVNDVQLFELTELVQSLWLEKAEKSNDVQAVDRLIAWSAANKLQISPKLIKRIRKMKSRTSSTCPNS